MKKSDWFIVVPVIIAIAVFFGIFYQYSKGLNKEQSDCQATCDPYAMVACIAIENGVLAVCKSESGYSAGLVE